MSNAPRPIELPTGIVTFLFTDIEGSTQLLHYLGDGYARVLADQRTLLREVFAAYQGYEVDTQGDAFFVAFARAEEALASAVEGQRKLQAHPWAQGVQVRVRMGLHTGQPMIGATGYVGMDVHRAARLAAAAHGGQVLLTQATRDSVGGALPRGVSLRDLGAARLKDLKQPEHVYQVVALELLSEFPPLKSLESLEAHYETLVKALTEGRVVPFLGSTVNLMGRTPNQSWQQGQATVLPSGTELADHLAKNFDYPLSEPQDLLRVSQYVSVMSGSGPLYDELHAVLDADYPPTALHQFFATLPASFRSKGFPARYPLLVTTNFDDALERAFRDKGEPFDLVAYIAEGEQRGKFVHWTPDGEAILIERPNEYRGIVPDQRTVILKIHGAVDRVRSEWDSFVVTEDHYIDFLARTDISNLLPVTIAAKLRKSHFLFLGYSVRDWNLRVILYRIWGQQRLTYKSWAVQWKPEPVEQEFWNKRNVEILKVRLEDYVEELTERVDALPRVEPKGNEHDPV